jgi:hypothetical protein
MESEAVALGAGRETESEKLVHIFWRNAYARIGYRDLGDNNAIDGLAGDFDGYSALVGLVFDDGVFGVGEEVGEDLDDILMVDGDIGGRIELAFDGDGRAGEGIGIELDGLPAADTAGHGKLQIIDQL